MISGPAFPTFSDAYLAILDALLNRSTYSTVTRGKTAIEILNASFTLARPWHRTPYISERKTNIIFNHAETLWYLSGRDDLEMISHYAPVLRSLSQDGQKLTGTAYGPRLFADLPQSARSQFDCVIDLLRADPDTKRAAMPIMHDTELSTPNNPDVSCTMGFHLLQRAGRLHAITYMRANDAMIGLLGDVFAFTFIQEFAARLLHVPLGTYGHHTGSMHLNTSHIPKAQAMLTHQGTSVFLDRPMPASTSWDDIRAVLNWEELLRTDKARFTPDLVSLDPYWREVISLFEVHRQISSTDEPVTAEALAYLRPAHRWLIEQRWPARTLDNIPEARES